MKLNLFNLIRSVIFAFVDHTLRPPLVKRWVKHIKKICYITEIDTKLLFFIRSAKLFTLKGVVNQFIVYTRGGSQQKKLTLGVMSTNLKLIFLGWWDLSRSYKKWLLYKKKIYHVWKLFTHNHTQGERAWLFVPRLMLNNKTNVCNIHIPQSKVGENIKL